MYSGWPITPVQKRSMPSPFIFVVIQVQWETVLTISLVVDISDVDAPFCQGYYVWFYLWLGFKPICVKVRVLGLKSILLCCFKLGISIPSLRICLPGARSHPYRKGRWRLHLFLWSSKSSGKPLWHRYLHHSHITDNHTIIRYPHRFYQLITI